MTKIFLILGNILATLNFDKLQCKFKSVKNYLYTGMICKHLKYAGKNIYIKNGVFFNDLEYIEIGDNSTIDSRCSITAWHKRGKQVFSPKLYIGNNVTIGTDCHITCINEIMILDGCLLGKMITISDNNHFSENHDLSDTPIKREISSKGAIRIEKGVWIADKATILAGVTIGEYSIIGSNAVVTKSIPPYSIVVGNPAKVITRK